MHGPESRAAIRLASASACPSGHEAVGRGLRRVVTIALLLAMPLLLAPCTPTFGQAGDSAGGRPLVLTLDAAIRLALQNNRGLIDARLARTLQEFALDVAGDRYQPTVTIGPSTQAQSEQDWKADIDAETRLRIRTGGQFALRWSKPIAGQDDGSGTVTLGFSQPLLKGFGASVDTAPLRSARLTDEVNMLAFREAIAGVVTSTIRAWRGLVRARRQLEIGVSSLERAKRQLEINRTLIEAGRMAAREILQSRADIADRELALVQSRNRVTAANFQLIDILDIDSATEVRPLEAPAARRSVYPLEEAIDVALRHSPARARALLDREIAAIELEVAENQTLWDLSLDAEASRVRDQTGGATDYAVRARLTIPLWDRTPKLEHMRARGRARQTERNLAEVRQATNIAVRQAVRDVEVGRRRIELAREARALSEEKLEIERSKLREGLSSTFQLGRFEEDLVRAQNAEVDALIDYENALTALDRTLGTTLETWDIGVEQVGQ